MTTLEMMNEAINTNDTYIAGSMRYSKKLGFHDNYKKSWDADAFVYVNDILEIDDWKLLPPKRMTMEEIEVALGYTVNLIS